MAKEYDVYLGKAVYRLTQTGSNPYAIQVRAEDAEKAQEILKALSE